MSGERTVLMDGEGIKRALTRIAHEILERNKGVTDIEAISDAIHKGWNTTAQAFVKNPDQFSDTEKLKAAGKLEAKLQQRAQLMKQNYAQLPEEEKEKDRVVARALLQAIKGEQGVAEGMDKGLSSVRESKKKKPKPTNPALWGRAKAYAKRTFDVYPSAYANAAASKWYKKHGGGWRMSEDLALTENELKCVDTNDIDYCVQCGNLLLPESYSGGLRKWFREKWVNIAKKKGGKHPPCGTSGEHSGYAKCVPAKKAKKMTKKQKASAVRRKRSAQHDVDRPGKDSPGSGHTPVFVKTKTKTNESVTQKYKVCWGPDQYTAIGSHVVDATSEQEAKRMVRKILDDTYGKLGWQEWKILYAVPLPPNNSGKQK